MTLQHPPALIATSLPLAPRCLVSWDQESQVISASILREPPQAHGLAQRLDEALSQTELERRVVVGDLDLLLDRQGVECPRPF
jgi:hypothetical protein